MKDLKSKIYESYTLTILITYLAHYKDFKKTYDFLKKSQWWNTEEIQEYQWSKFKEIIEHCYYHVPYYQNLFNQIGLTPDDIRSLKDLQKIPLLTKEIMQNNTERLKATNYPEYKFEYATTGGTTGTPIGIYCERFVRIAKQMAYFQMMTERIGCSIKDKSVEIRSHIFPSKKGKFWKRSLFGRRLLLSPFHINEKTLPKYIEKIKQFKPKYIFSYPSSISAIAAFMRHQKVSPFSSLRGVICMGETLYDWQQDLIRQVLRCNVLGYYGHAEQSLAAGMCEKSNYYHIFPDFGIIELVDSKGKEISAEDREGEIVVTGLSNPLFPCIRYKTEDFGIYAKEKCACGRESPRLKYIIGRSQEYVVTSDDRRIPIAALNMHIDVFDNVRQFQFYQEKRGEVILRIVKLDSYTDKDTAYIKRELTKKLGNVCSICIDFVENIPTTDRGKHAYLIQKIPVENNFCKWV